MKYLGYVVAILLSLGIGYLAGREHLKYEMQSALLSAADEFQRGLSSAFGGTAELERAESENSEDELEPAENLEKIAYIAESIELYDLSAKYTESLMDGRVPGVLFKIRNAGDRSLDRVEVTVYFKGADGTVIAEEDYVPVLVSEYALSGDSKPLKPGYIWQMEQGKFYAAKSVPSEWEEGSIDAAITDIRFSE